jgi:DNA modification methylase
MAMADALIENTCALGDCREIMRRWIEAGVRVQTCVTSPPYWGLRDYGVEGQLGLEETPEEYIANMVEVFRLVRDLLADDGTLWLNLGDSYAANGTTGGGSPVDMRKPEYGRIGSPGDKVRGHYAETRRIPVGLKPKDLVGIPWRVAFALQADGWYLRSDIIWAKPNPMPESVTDRPTKAHEYLFLLAKSERYYYDAEAIAESSVYPGDARHLRTDTRKLIQPGCIDNGSRARTGHVTGLTRNRRTVWTITTQAYSEAHFATFPEKLVEPCILAGTNNHGLCPDCGKQWRRVVDVVRENASNAARAGTVIKGKGHPSSQVRSDHDVRNGPVRRTITNGWRPDCECGRAPIPAIVFDPFMGSGTVARVALRLQRRWLGCELNPAYLNLQQRRTSWVPVELAL